MIENSLTSGQVFSINGLKEEKYENYKSISIFDYF